MPFGSLTMGMGMGHSPRPVAATAPVTDPFYANVVLLLSGDGTDASTTFTDESGSAKTPTVSGNAQIDTAEKKFGTGSMLFDGSGDFLTYADHDDWYWPGEFTMETWARPNLSGLAAAGFANLWSNLTGGCFWQFGYFYGGAATKRFTFTFSPTGNPAAVVTLQSTNSDVDQSVFHHVAVSRDASSKIRLFVDGVMVDSETGISGGVNGTQPMRVGCYQGAGSSVFAGWIDEFRITKGVCRYGSDAGFAVPTAAFPRS